MSSGRMALSNSSPVSRPSSRAASRSVVRSVGDAAEAANHHPDIDIRYNKVRLALTTHDSGGITLLDLALAGAIDRLRPDV